MFFFYIFFLQKKFEQQEKEEEAAGMTITAKKKKPKTGRQAKMTASGALGSTKPSAVTKPSPFAEIVDPIIPEFCSEKVKAKKPGKAASKKEKEDPKQKKLDFIEDKKDDVHVDEMGDMISIDDPTPPPDDHIPSPAKRPAPSRKAPVKETVEEDDDFNTKKPSKKTSTKQSKITFKKPAKDKPKTTTKQKKKAPLINFSFDEDPSIDDLSDEDIPPPPKKKPATTTTQKQQTKKRKAAAFSDDSDDEPILPVRHFVNCYTIHVETCIGVHNRIENALRLEANYMR